ncbi:MAG: hypothetical protein HUK24_01250 [Sphaerochaetaceae bacterium]|nr:hypothetical protein [Sphaerochaetaceae bacterium]
MKKFIVILAVLLCVSGTLFAKGSSEKTAKDTAGSTTVVAENLTLEVVPTYVKETVFTTAQYKDIAKTVADLCADKLWKEIAISSAKIEYCPKNTAILKSDEAVIAAVKGNTYKIGILPAGSPVPEGMVELKITF